MRLFPLLALASAGALFSAAPPVSKPIQSLQLSKTEKLDGIVALANQSTVLFIPDGEKNTVRVVAIAPTGQQIWATSIVKTRHLLGTVNVWKAMAGGDMESRAMLGPVQVYSAGNTVITCETIRKDNPMKLKEGLLVVQRIDEQGKVVRYDFTQPVAPKKVERDVMGRYASSDGLYMVTKYTDAREETATYFLEHYNPTTQKIQQLPLTLPKPYVTKNEEQSYHDWILAGRRNEKIYFYRALRGTNPKDNPSKIPVEYEFRVYDDNAKQVGGFTTAIHQKLQPNSFINYSGSLTHFPLQGHVEEYVTKTSSNGRSYSSTTFDTYTVSTGGLGEIYLDPASEDIYIAGEYGSTTYDPRSQEDILGTFFCKFRPDGTMVSVVQNPYPAEIKKDSKFLLGSYYDPRSAALFVNPVTHDMGLAFEQAKRAVTVTYDSNLQLLKHHTITFKQAPSHNLWLVGQSYANSSNMGYPQMEIPRQYAENTQSGYCRKVYDLAERTTPVTKDKDAPMPFYYCNPQPNDGALVIRALDKLGTPIDIYAL